MTDLFFIIICIVVLFVVFSPYSSRISDALFKYLETGEEIPHEVFEPTLPVKIFLIVLLILIVVSVIVSLIDNYRHKREENKYQ